MLFDDLPLHRGQLPILACVVQGGAWVGKTVPVVAVGFIVPIIQKVIMQQCTADQRPLVYAQVQRFRQDAGGIRHADAVGIHADLAVLDAPPGCRVAALFFQPGACYT